jgi:cytochrome c-type biogenesis protein CcmH/NrfG
MIKSTNGKWSGILLILGLALATPAVGHAQTADSTHHDSTTARRWDAKGDAYVAAGFPDSARLAYERALQYNGDDIDATVKMATILINEGHGRYAVDLLSFALKRHPTDPRLLNFRAIRPGADTTGAVTTGP